MRFSYLIANKKKQATLLLCRPYQPAVFVLKIATLDLLDAIKQTLGNWSDLIVADEDTLVLIEEFTYRSDDCGGAGAEGFA